MYISMSRLSLRLAGMSCLTCVLASSTFSLAMGAQEGGAQEEPTAVSDRIEISKETTYYTEPLDENGRVDFLAALNADVGEGVTKENNAAVHIFHLLGPEAIGAIPAEALEKMGVDWDSVDEDYVETLDTYAVRKQLSFDEGSEYNQAMQGPWKRADLPEIAAWLEANDEGMDRLAAAIEMPRFFIPLIQQEGGNLMTVMLDHVQSSRSWARGLSARGFNRLGEGDYKGAIDDFHTIHRLGRHLSNGTTLIEHLVGIAIEGIAYNGEIRVLEASWQMRDVYAYFEEKMASLPPRVPSYVSLNRGERLMGIEIVTQLAQANDEQDQMLEEIGVPAIVLRFIGKAAFDWNEVLRKLNQNYDRQVAIAKLPAEERDAAAEEYFTQIEESANNISTPAGILTILSSIGTDNHKAEQAFVMMLMSLLSPAMQAVWGAETRTDMYHEVVLTGIALEHYRLANGKYPADLGELVPNFLEEVPVDRFIGEPLKYQSDDENYLLYSVGQNKIDDGGRTHSDLNHADDIRVKFGR